MSKNITEWKLTDTGEIEKIVTIDGEVVEEAEPEPSTGGGGWSFGSWWRQPEPVNDNGREYTTAKGWQYTPAANGDASQYEIEQTLIDGWGDSMATDVGI